MSNLFNDFYALARVKEEKRLQYKSVVSLKDVYSLFFFFSITKSIKKFFYYKKKIFYSFQIIAVRGIMLKL
jgi:hypothetical protein